MKQGFQDLWHFLVALGFKMFLIKTFLLLLDRFLVFTIVKKKHKISSSMLYNKMINHWLIQVMWKSKHSWVLFVFQYVWGTIYSLQKVQRIVFSTHFMSVFFICSFQSIYFCFSCLVTIGILLNICIMSNCFISIHFWRYFK